MSSDDTKIKKHDEEIFDKKHHLNFLFTYRDTLKVASGDTYPWNLLFLADKKTLTQENGIKTAYAFPSSLARVIKVVYFPEECGNAAEDLFVALRIGLRFSTSPYIARIRSCTVKKSADLYYVYEVMNYYPHKSLFDYLFNKKQSDKKILVQENQILNWGICIAQGLAELHKQNVMLRNLRSKHLLLDADPTYPGTLRLRIGNFEKAIIGTELAFRAGTNAGDFYIAPEQEVTREGDTVNYDYKVDIWALGSILYELLTLRYPVFSGATIASRLRKNIPDNFYSKALVEFVLTCLNSESADDRPTAEQCVTKLNEILAIPPSERLLQSKQNVTVKDKDKDKEKTISKVDETTESQSTTVDEIDGGTEAYKTWKHFAKVFRKHDKYNSYTFLAYLKVAPLRTAPWYIVFLAEKNEKDCKTEGDRFLTKEQDGFRERVEVADLLTSSSSSFPDRRRVIKLTCFHSGNEERARKMFDSLTLGLQFSKSQYIIPTRALQMKTDKETSDVDIYVFMDYFPDGSLFSYVLKANNQRLLNSQPQPIVEDLVLKWGICIAKGLAEIHESNIILGNLSSKHLLFDKDQVRIGNFGKARTGIHLASGPGINVVDLYIAPEQEVRDLDDTIEYNYKVDIWAFGCILYELVTLRLPGFTGVTVTQCLSKKLPNNFYSKALIELILTCLNFDPSARPTAQQCVEKLEKIIEIPSLERVLQSSDNIVMPECKEKTATTKLTKTKKKKKQLTTTKLTKTKKKTTKLIKAKKQLPIVEKTITEASPE